LVTAVHDARQALRVEVENLDIPFSGRRKLMMTGDGAVRRGRLATNFAMI
jgi:hypothetical protein